MSIQFDFARKTKPTGSLYEKGVYPPEFNDEFKEYIRQRDGYVCALCDEKRPLDVHHLNYTKYTVKINCISLCRECHDIVHEAQWWQHSLRTMWATYFYRITQIREGIKTNAQLAAAWRQTNAN